MHKMDVNKLAFNEGFHPEDQKLNRLRQEYRQSEALIAKKRGTGLSIEEIRDLNQGRAEVALIIDPDLH